MNTGITTTNMKKRNNGDREKIMAKVSVILPVYNTEKYLPRCLDALVNQTLEDLEIIAVDDGSTDHSPAVLKKYAGI